MKLTAVLTGISLFAIGAGVLSSCSSSRPKIPEAMSPAEMAAATATGESGTAMRRVTSKPFKMDSFEPQPEGLSLPALDDWPSPGEVVGLDSRRENPHEHNYCHVFVNDRGLSTLKSGKGEYPEGSLIVKQKFSDSKGENTVLFTVMRKMGKNYNPQHGNWEYSIVSGSATSHLRGNTQSCIDCHDGYAKTDYVTRTYMSQP